MSHEMFCVLCGQKVKSFRREGPRPDDFYVECRICGRYKSDDLTDEGFKHLPKETKAMISAFTRELSEYDAPVPELGTFDDEQIEKIIERYKKKTIMEKLDNLILYIGRNSHYFGHPLKIHGEIEYPITYSVDKEEFDNIYSQAKEVKLIELPISEGNTKLTWKGWEKFENFKESGGFSKRCFVAMSCSEDMNEIYSEGIEKAVTEAGYKSIFIEKEEHNEKICDLIISEIRACRFLIADVTGQRQNVYYEAGFAHGLNRDVIWTCKRDEIEKAHFDTRQYNHLTWENAEDLRKKLLNRIRATIL